jgi:hypothetical protein
MRGVLTSEKVLFQAPLLHVFVDKEEMFILPAVTQEFDKVWMRQFSQELHLRLQPRTKSTYIINKILRKR